MKKLLLPLVVLAATILFVSPTMAEELVLRYKATPGNSSIYKLINSGVTTIHVDEQAQVTTVENELFLKQSVTAYDKDSGIISYETKVASGILKINGAESSMPMMGQVISTQMKNTGEFLNPANTETARLNAAQLVFPEGPLEVGAEWTHTMEPNSQMPVPTIITFKVIGEQMHQNRNCIKIGMNITSDNSKEVKGLSMNLNAKGVILFDAQAGMLISNHVNSEIRMSIERVIGGKQTKINTRMEMKVRMDLQV